MYLRQGDRSERGRGLCQVNRKKRKLDKPEKSGEEKKDSCKLGKGRNAFELAEGDWSEGNRLSAPRREEARRTRKGRRRRLLKKNPVGDKPWHKKKKRHLGEVSGAPGKRGREKVCREERGAPAFWQS